jgi:threonine/homoserine/homoserine lactone efflux protein
VGDLAGFFALAIVVIVTPGPDTALTIRNSLVGGRAAGVATAIGVALGQATWSVATSAGVVALLVAVEPAFAALRVAGAAYLVLLGLQALWSASRSHPSAGAPIATPRRMRPGSALRQGVISNLTNPKMAVFFPSLLPQFVSADAPSFAAILGLGLLFCVMTLAWLSAYAFAVARAGDVLRRSTVRRTIEAVTGVLLVAFGIRVASAAR